MMERRTRRNCWGFILAAASLLATAILACGMILSAQSAQTTANPTQPDASDADGFPHVDWSYWQQVNPDVIGWVSVPGTDISSALVQAPADDPTYYLTHDVHRRQNHHGCPYLDAECARAGLLSDNAVIFGHHIKYGAPMFASFARYSDAAFAEEHPTILVQTPDDKRVLRVSGAAVISGHDRTKRTSFSGIDDFQEWYTQRMAECCVRRDERIPECCTTFVTCSYTSSANERTVVYAI